MKTTLFGLTVLISVAFGFIPFINHLFTIIYIAVADVFTSSWKEVDSSIRLLSFTIFQYTISFCLAYALAIKLKLKERLPSPLAGKYLIWVGGLIIVVPSLIAVLALIFGANTYDLPFLLKFTWLDALGKALFYIGLLQLALAINPSKKFTYEYSE